MIGSRLPGFEGPPADSMMFVAEQVGASVDEQLSTADALDVKIGGLLALSVGVALTYLAIVIPLIPKFDVAAAVGTGLTFGYGFGCCFQALRGLRVGSYRRWPNPAEYAKLASGTVAYEVRDLARQAAVEKAKDHATNREELLWKSLRLRWSLAFVAAQLIVTVLAALHAATL